MKNLKDLNLELKYNTKKHSTVEEYFIPCLSVSKYFFRGIGFFTASSLLDLSRGLSVFLSKRDAKIQLLLSVALDEEETQLIKRGYELKEDVKNYNWLNEKIENDLSNAIDEIDKIGRMPIDLITKLIALDILEIKIAALPNGIFHAKLSLFTDYNDNSVASEGSNNQSNQGQSFGGKTKSFESFSVYKSWEHEHFNVTKELIDELWKEQFDDMLILPFSEALEKKYLRSRINNNNFTDEISMTVEAQEDFYKKIEVKKSKKSPIIPETLNSKPYQIKKHQVNALQNWKRDNYIGILEHATGSGKTVTSIHGATKIYEQRGKLALIVSVPYQELRDQWREELEKFSWSPIICAGDWQDTLSENIDLFNEGRIDNLCIIVANKTMSENSFYKEQIDRLDNDKLMFIGDECHHHTTQLRRKSIPDAKFILGLSATPFHYFDKNKVEITKDIYKNISDSFSLKQALDEGILTPMRYNTEQVFLTADEFEEYKDLSASIARYREENKKKKKNKKDLTPLIVERARLLSSSSEKIPSLITLLKRNKSIESHSLFYVGDGRIDDDREHDNSDEQRQIERISIILDELGWKTSRFTYKESLKERKFILEDFEDQQIDGIVAIKCLDEGIDIPVCKAAYLISSGKDKRQYIQRAGRILRKADGKELANIYDFLIFPFPDDSDDKASKTMINLIKGELKRAHHFITHSINGDEQKKRISSWLSNYNLDYDELIQDQEFDEI